MDVFNYKNKKLEKISCNICNSNDAVVIADKSVNNLPVNTVMCKGCSLVYINPRMTRIDYDEYYKLFYRQDRAHIKQREFVNNLDRNFESARKFGKAIVTYMNKYVRPGLTIDVGSSTGGILYGMREMKKDIKPLGIEPSLDESNFANEKGIETIRTLFEDVKLDLNKKAANILCVQSLNHLLDPKSFLQWAHKTLEPGGHIFLAVKNWRHQVRRMGKLSSGVQIDHVYMFTPETLNLLCKTTGFKVVYMDIDEGKRKEDILKQKKDGLNTHHIRIVAQKDVVPEKIVVPRSIYRKARFQLWPFFVKAIYIFKYSSRLAFLRKLIHI